MTLTDKIKLIAILCADTRLTYGERVAAIAMLARFHNTVSGACYPSYSQLAEAGTNETTAKRTTRKLRDLGYMSFVASTGGRNKRNSYYFKRVSQADPLEGETVSPADHQGSASGPARVSPADPHIPCEINPMSTTSLPSPKSQNKKTCSGG